MESVEQLFQTAVELHRAGSCQEARPVYERILATQPGRADVWNLLGIALRSLRLPGEAIQAFQQAIAHDWSQAAYFRNLAAAHVDAQQFDDAIAANQRAIALAPQLMDARCNLAGLLQRSGRLEEALTAIEAAVSCDSRYPDAHYNLGTVLQSMGRLPAAAHAYEEAVRLRPDFVLAHTNLGNIYHKLGKPAAAVESYQRALEAQPDFAVALSNLNTVLQKQGRQEEIIACYERAVQVRPDFAEAHANLGRACLLEGKLAKAEASLLEGLRLAPHLPEAHYNLGMLYLMQQRFAEGWPEYLWRLGCKGIANRDLPGPLWQGEELRGRTLLVYADQGFGDLFQMVRYLPLVRARGGRVLFEVHPALMPLLRVSGYEDVYARGTEVPAYDLRVPMMNLPAVFGTTLETIPRTVPYLKPDPALVADWKARLARYPGLKVGICWQGNREYTLDARRSMSLHHFAALAAVDGVSLISLQKADGTEQASAAACGLVVHPLDELDAQSGAFMDTAAVMQHLDLVIACETAVVHLAGALGVPVWTALSHAPDWRWFLDRDDTPWYPTMRLFKQHTAGDWPGVFGRMAAELARRSSPPQTLPVSQQ